MRIFSSLFLFCVCILQGLSVSAWQPVDSAAVPAKKDSLVSPFVQKVQAAGEKDRRESQQTYEAGKIKIRQRAVWEALGKTAQDVKIYLVSGIPVKSVADELASVKASFAVVQDGIFTNMGTAQTDRNLSVSSAILYQLIAETDNRKKQVDQYTADLIGYRNRIDSLLSDPVIYVFPTDSVALIKYLSRLRVIVSQGNPSDNALNETLESFQGLQNETDSLLFVLQSSYEKLSFYRDRLSHINLKREFADMWHAPGHHRPFAEILRFSLAKEKMALQFYIRENVFKILALVFLVLLTCFALRSFKKRLLEDGQSDAELNKRLLLKHPVAASLIVVLSIYQFAFINAPFIFSFCIWSAEVICLFILLRGYISSFWLNFWIVLSVLFLGACLDNFVLQASRSERWVITILSFAGIVYGCFILFNRHRKDLKEQSILLFIRFLVVAALLAFLLNLFGRYNLSKILLIVGYTGVVNAILFLWVVRLINEGLALGASLYRYPERKLFYINFNRVGNRAPAILYVLLVLGWVVLVGRHFYAFRSISVPFETFLHKERVLGSYSFTINGMALFILITTCSMVLSRIVSFFGADSQATHGNTAHGSRKVAVGSWILLVRIFIISIGLFLAFAAAGLPLDKITIVLGALSVGIGLGLQGLVSNLISGLIIAFEKPVNVGDQIEVSGKSGTMKSIGFRSSTVLLGDGSSLVVPNGDLLNNHLVNWSAGRRTKRLTIPLSVAYGSDLKQVKEVLEGIANADERVLKSPAAQAVPKGFGEGAIHTDLIVWIKSLQDSVAVTGSIIIAIDAAFREQGIVIPYPRQDVHIYRDPVDDTDTAGENDS